MLPLVTVTKNKLTVDHHRCATFLAVTTVAGGGNQECFMPIERSGQLITFIAKVA